MITQIDKKEFNIILDFTASSTGIILPETNYSLLDSLLKERLSSLNISLEEYIKLIKNDNEERIYFIDTITINETYFFREEKHFDILLDAVFLEFKKKKKYPLKIWSAACSSGEEAISLYLSAEKYFGSNELFSVFASDINQNIIKIFDEGLYKKNSFREDGEKYHDLIFKKSMREKSVKIDDKIIHAIKKNCINLSTLKKETLEEKFDLIFLRNTLIYFDINNRPSIIDSLVEKLNDDGFLFLSSSEVPFISHHYLELQEKYGSYYFQKKCKNEKKGFQFINLPLIEEIKKHEKKDDIKPEFLKISDLKIILDFANKKLENKLFELPKNQEYELALMLIKIIYFINIGDFLMINNLLDIFKKSTGNNEVCFYITGIIKMMKNENKEAVKYFDISLIENPNFWPARFYRAKLYYQNESLKKSYLDFLKCREDIEEYINGKFFYYQIFLDGFNGKYFLNICRKWMEKLQGTGK